MNLGQKFADLEDALQRIAIDLREVASARYPMEEEDHDMLMEAWTLADLYLDAVLGNVSWEEAQKQMRKVLYD